MRRAEERALEAVHAVREQVVAGFPRKNLEFDAKLAILEEPVVKKATDAKARLALTGSSQGRQNMREAVPHLASIARSDATDSSMRIRELIGLSRAHLGVAESEKGRHEAEALIAVRGPKTTEAWAGGSLLLASREAKANRTARARQGLDEVIAATSDSADAGRAGDELAGPPREER